jgi:hypothetical protein
MWPVSPSGRWVLFIWGGLARVVCMLVVPMIGLGKPVGFVIVGGRSTTKSTLRFLADLIRAPRPGRVLVWAIFTLLRLAADLVLRAPRRGGVAGVLRAR